MMNRLKNWINSKSLTRKELTRKLNWKNKTMQIADENYIERKFLFGICYRTYEFEIKNTGNCKPSKEDTPQNIGFG